MAVAFVRDIPGVTTELYDAVVRDLGVDKEPAAGLIVHTAGPFGDNNWREIDVWESREAWETFHRDRLWPAIQRIYGENAPDSPLPDPEYLEVYDLIQ